MPFPLGLRLVADEASAFVPWAWGVNGFFTVIGSVTAMIVGMAFGFTATLAAAALCYLTALAAISLARTA
jgi:hypothetical protein